MPRAICGSRTPDEVRPKSRAPSQLGAADGASGRRSGQDRPRSDTAAAIGRLAEPRCTGRIEPVRAARRLGQCVRLNPIGVCHVRYHAANARGRRSFRPPDAFLESADGPVHLRPSQQDPHHQSREDPGQVPGRDEVHASARGQPRHGAVRRHQAPGPRDRRRGSGARRHAVRRPALARRHADQLQDRQDLDQAAQGHGDHGLRGAHGADVEEGSR